MKTLASFVLSVSLCCLAGSGLRAQDAAPAKFEVRAVAEKAGSGVKEYNLPAFDGMDAEKLLLNKATLLDTSAIESATATTDAEVHPAILLKFTEAGAKQLAEVTRKYQDKRLGFLIDGQLYTASVIRGVITGGKAQIVGSFTQQQASDLAARLNAAVAAKATAR